MDPSLKESTFTSSRTLTYTYYTHPASTASKPTLLLLHGCPDSAALWSNLCTKYFIPQGYGVIVPDLLGYAGTSKPTDVAAYAVDLMVDDLAELLTHALDSSTLKVVSVGHDWGAILAQRVYTFYPDRVLGVCSVSVAYATPTGQEFDVKAMSEMLEPMLGYTPFGYWPLFLSARVHDVMDGENVRGVFEALHADPPEDWVKLLGRDGALEEFLRKGERHEVCGYAKEEGFREQWVERLQRDGFEAPLRWYKAMARGLHLEAERRVLEKRGSGVDVPFLFLRAVRDVLCLEGSMDGPVKGGLLPKLTVEKVDAGHWCMLAEPQKTAEAVLGWLRSDLQL